MRGNLEAGEITVIQQINYKKDSCEILSNFKKIYIYLSNQVQQISLKQIINIDSLFNYSKTIFD